MRNSFTKFLFLVGIISLAAVEAAAARSWPRDNSQDVFSRRYRGADEVHEDRSGSSGHNGGDSSGGSDSGSVSSHGEGAGGGSSGDGSSSGKGPSSGKSGAASGDEDDRFGKK